MFRIIFLLFLLLTARHVIAEDADLAVRISEEVAYIDVIHKGKPVRIQREQNHDALYQGQVAVDDGVDRHVAEALVGPYLKKLSAILYSTGETGARGGDHRRT